MTADIKPRQSRQILLKYRPLYNIHNIVFYNPLSIILINMQPGMLCLRIIFPEPEEIFFMYYNIFTININYTFLNEGRPFFMQRKTCIIIGNRDLPRDFSTQINAADYVLRFNRPRALGGWSRKHTDRLMICNSDKPMQLILKDADFLNSDFIKNTCDIVFVYHPAIMRRYFKKTLMTSRLFHGRKVEWTYEGIDILGRSGKPATVLLPEFYLAACREIGISRTLPPVSVNRLSRHMGSAAAAATR